jgi:hypothetical protein
MRLSPRLLPAARVALFTILFIVSCAATSHAAQAQPASALPKSWNDAVARLVDKIAAAMSPTAINLDVESVSSLDASYVAAVAAALRNQLKAHSFSLASPNSAAAESSIQLKLTLSESAAEYVWVIQAVDDSSDANPLHAMIVSVPKADFTEAEPDEQSLTLAKQLVWAQPQKFLDFALLQAPSPDQSLLLVLEPTRLVTYKRSGSGWQLSHTAAIPSAKVPSRDPEGTIKVKDGNISIGGFQCVGDPDLTGGLRCTPAKPNRSIETQVKISGLPNSLGSLVQGDCRGETISLYTGEGDWTQKDSIQGYLVNLNSFSAAAAGDAIQLNGPAIALGQEQGASAARVIVHNLKSGSYEGYIVTATCSH